MLVLGIDVSPAARLEKTGTEWYTCHLVEALKQVIPQGVRVILYTSSKPLKNIFGDLPAGWEEKILNWPLKKVWTQARLAFELRREPPDVFFSPAQILPRLILKNNSQRPRLVTTIHDLAWKFFPSMYGWRERNYLEYAAYLAAKYADLIIVPSHATERDLLSFYPHAKNRIAVVPHGIDERYFSVTKETAEAARNRYGLPEQFLIVIGRLENKKNTSAIIKTFLSLVENSSLPPEAAIVFAGKPGRDWDKRIFNLAKNRFPNRFFCLGWVLPGDLPSLVGAASGLILWSCYEGFGLPCLEGMAAGTPVIAAAHSALPETVGDAGLLVTADDCGAMATAIQQLFLEQTLAEKLIYRGYDRAKQFSWQKTALETWRAIENMIQY